MKALGLTYYIGQRSSSMCLTKFLRMQVKRKFMKILVNNWFLQSQKGIMRVYLLMEQLGREKRIRWLGMMKIQGFQFWQLTNCFSKFTRIDWTNMNLKFHMLKFTTKSFEIYWWLTQKIQWLIFERIQWRDFNLLEWLSFELTIQNKLWNFYRQEIDVELQRLQMLIKHQVDLMLYFNWWSVFRTEHRGLNKKF